MRPPIPSTRWSCLRTASVVALLWAGILAADAWRTMAASALPRWPYPIYAASWVAILWVSVGGRPWRVRLAAVAGTCALLLVLSRWPWDDRKGLVRAYERIGVGMSIEEARRECGGLRRGNPLGPLAVQERPGLDIYHHGNRESWCNADHIELRYELGRVTSKERHLD